jgi:hypothetical protein
MNALPAILNPEFLTKDAADRILLDGPEDPVSRPIDQAETASPSIAAPEHEKVHDERLWAETRPRDAAPHRHHQLQLLSG